MIKKLDKRGISIMIGYVLLITSAVIMSTIVYQWMKTYVPKDTIECVDGISLVVSSSECLDSRLTINVKNNGRFDVAGYFIYAINSSEQDLATIDLSSKIHGGGQNLSGAVIFENWLDNYLAPGSEIMGVFDLDSDIYGIEIVPVRFQVIDNKKRFVNCGKAKIKENIVCTTTEIPELPAGCVDDTGCTGDEVCIDTVCTLCGNGIVDEGEMCDSVEGCSDTCQPLQGYGCSPDLNLCS